MHTKTSCRIGVRRKVGLKFAGDGDSEELQANRKSVLLWADNVFVLASTGEELSNALYSQLQLR